MADIFCVDIILAACDVEGNFLVVKVSSVCRNRFARGIADHKYHRPINIQISFRPCCSTRKSGVCRASVKLSNSSLLDGQSLCACSFCTFTFAGAITGRNFSYVPRLDFLKKKTKKTLPSYYNSRRAFSSA